MVDKVSVAIIAGQLVVGGAERQLYLWLANLDRQRFDPIVITLHPGYGDYWEKPIEDLGIPLFCVQRKRNRLARLLEIISVIRPHQPDLIHGWHTFASSYAGVCARALGTKSLGGVRSSYTAIDNTLETKLTRFFCDAVLFNSKTTAHAYRGSQRREKQTVFTVQNAIDAQFDDRQEVRDHLVQAYGLPADTIWVASIGRLDPLKRFDLLLQIAAALKKDIPNVHFLLVGDGPEKGDLVDLSKALGVEDVVTFTGEVPFASRWMRGFDIFCFPSVDEGLPNAVMEAAGAGLPIVAWRYPFNEELLVDEEIALLVEPIDIIALKDALARLISSKSLRDQLGSNAQTHIEKNFSLERYIDAMTVVYETMLEKRS